MNKGAAYSIVFILVVLALFSAAFFARSQPGEYEPLAQCVAQSGTVFYGAWWCPACTRQKAYFGKASKELPYLECASPGARGSLDAPECAEKNITQTPTWEFPGNQNRYGVLPRESIAHLADCPLTFEDGKDLTEQTGEAVLESITDQLNIADGEQIDVIRTYITDIRGIDLLAATGSAVAGAIAELRVERVETPPVVAEPIPALEEQELAE